MPRGRSVICSSAILLLLAGCAAMRNTPAQDLAHERWDKCSHFRTITLKDITPSGQIWVWNNHGPDYQAWLQCESAAREEQRKAGRLAATQGALTNGELKALVRHAYFTDKPPSDSFILSTPPQVTQFDGSKPVTFFYGLKMAGRVFSVQARWIGPDGKVVKTIEQTMDQTSRASAVMWTWRTQALPAAELTQPGAWTVEFVVDGQNLGSYLFTVQGNPSLRVTEPAKN
jgi:hypothetical protein